MAWFAWPGGSPAKCRRHVPCHRPRVPGLCRTTFASGRSLEWITPCAASGAPSSCPLACLPARAAAAAVSCAPLRVSPDRSTGSHRPLLSCFMWHSSRSPPPHLFPTPLPRLAHPQLQPRLAVPWHRRRADGAGCGKPGDGGEPGPPAAALLVSVTVHGFCVGPRLALRVFRRPGSDRRGRARCVNVPPWPALPLPCSPEDLAWNPRHLMLASAGGYGRDNQGVEYGEIEFRWR